MFFPPHPDRRPTLVTGASSGIGAATARLVASKGHPVVLAARRLDRCRELADAIAKEGGEAHAVYLDLADHDSVSESVRAAEAAVGPLDTVVSNGGRSQVGTVVDTTSAAMSKVLDVNVEGTHALMRAVLPGMLERTAGTIVVVGSEMSRLPRPGMSAYITSKAALEGYVAGLQMELEGTGVRATLLRPGPTATEMGSDWEGEATAKTIQLWQHWGLARHFHFLAPEELAASIVAVMELPRGVLVTSIDVGPEGPIDQPAAPEEAAP